LPSLGTNPRALDIQGFDYGVDPDAVDGGAPSDLPVSLQQSITFTGTNTVTTVGSYNFTVTDVLSTQSSSTLSLASLGFTGSDAIMSGETQTTSTDWTVALQSSFSATAQSSVSVKGVLDDHHGLKNDGALLPYRPRVELFQDALFGTLMFQDMSGAPPAP
jgi:hypothetical protein